jgi:hypothetical protein
MDSSRNNPAAGTGELPAINTPLLENVEAAASSTIHRILTRFEIIIRTNLFRIYTAVAVVLILATKAFAWHLPYLRDIIMWGVEQLQQLYLIVKAFDIPQVFILSRTENLYFVLFFGSVVVAIRSRDSNVHMVPMLLASYLMATITLVFTLGDRSNPTILVAFLSFLSVLVFLAIAFMKHNLDIRKLEIQRLELIQRNRG